MGYPIVIILTHAYPKGFERCLRSFEATGFPLDRIKIILNGVDKTRYDKVLSEYADKVLEVIDLPKNVGFFKAFNKGLLSVSIDEFVVLCNDDIEILSSDWYDEFFEKMEDGVGMVGIKTAYTDVKGNVKVDDKRLMSFCLLNPLAVRVSGILDERYFNYYGDFEYIFRMHGNGFKIIGILSRCVRHDIKATFRIQRKSGVLRFKWIETDMVHFYKYTVRTDFQWKEKLTDFPVKQVVNEVRGFLRGMGYKNILPDIE